MLIFLIPIIFIGFIVYLKVKYFTFHGPIPGKAPQILFGNLLQIGLTRGRYMGDIIEEFQRTYGDTFQILFAFFHLIFICHPDDVKHVFAHRQIYEQGDFRQKLHRLAFNDAIICNIGAKYKRHASIILPLFRRGRIVTYFDLITDSTDKLLNQWRSMFASDPKHIHLNMVEQCQNFSLSIFALIGFNYDLDTLENSRLERPNELREALNDYIDIFFRTARLPYALAGIYLKFHWRYQQARKTIENYLHEIIEQERKKTAEEIAEKKRTSLLVSLVTSLQEDEQAEAMKPEQEKKGLSHAEIVDELLLFLIAGSESIATVLSWFIYLMSKYPRVQAKLKTELDAYQSREMIFDEVDNLNYLDCVINEILRFRTPFPGVTRTLTADDRLPFTGFLLHEGDEICVPLYNLAHDKRLWKIDPDLFYPERFQTDDKDNLAFVSIAFGGGHRQCIGQDLARFELKTIITRLMQNVTFGDGGEQVNAGGYFQRLSTVPKSLGVTITFD